MKKIAIFALAFSAMNAFAWEANVKGGFDVLRTRTTRIKDVEDTKKVSQGSGWTIGAEFIPFNKGVLEFGVGAEYNAGVSTLLYNSEVGGKPAIVDGKEVQKGAYLVPVYGLAKLNLARAEDNSAALYTFGRLGYAFGGPSTMKVDAPTNEVKVENSRGGLYYGAGLGVEIGRFVIEGLYDGVYTFKYSNDSTAADKNMSQFAHKIGLRAGLRFGDYLIEKEMVEEVVPEVVVVRPKHVETKGLIHASCDEDAKLCVIHGFKVDGRVPNAEERQNIAEIANLVNEFAVSGTADIIGHTDSTGSDAYNMKLSVARAQSVNKLLREAGLKNSIVVEKITGEGERNPMDTNKTKAGRYNNRRVEIRFSELNR